MSSFKLTIKSNAETLALEDLQLSEENRKKVNQLLEEFTYFEALNTLNLPVDNKIILHGATGCGKTATANAIAKQLNKKIISLNLGGFVSSKLGETAKNITSIFRTAKLEEAVLFIDEFDFIGKARDYNDKDSGEMKRLVNTLLQQIDSLDKETLLIGATNHIDVIDSALLRRFQLRMQYDFPTKKQLDNYYKNLFNKFPKEVLNFEKQYNISYAEAKDYVYQKVKANVIQKEKQRKQSLFSYGTLQLKETQATIYGRILKEEKDSLLGYKTEQVNNHRFAVKTKENHCIEGTVLELTSEELFKTDSIQGKNYKRVLETLASGSKVWIYSKR